MKQHFIRHFKKQTHVDLVLCSKTGEKLSGLFQNEFTDLSPWITTEKPVRAAG